MTATTSRITPEGARWILARCGVTTGVDFHALDTDQVYHLLQMARLHGYRKPAQANGSTARYWHAYLVRRAVK